MTDANQLAEALRGLLNAVDCYGMPFNHADRNLARQALAAFEAQESQLRCSEPHEPKQDETGEWA